MAFVVGGNKRKPRKPRAYPTGVIGGRPEVSGRYPTGVIGGRPEISGAYGKFKPPQIWPPPGMFGGLPEDYYTGARAWWKDIDQWAYEQVMGGYPFAQQPGGGYPGGGGRGYPGGGGGGGGGMEGMPTPRFTLGDILKTLQFPGEWQYPSYLRDFGRYLEELITQNPQFAVPVPEMGEEGTPIPAPEDLDTLEYMETAETYATAWNNFLGMLVNMPFPGQQEYVGLRYTPQTDWFRSGAVPMLPHPEFL